MAGYSGYSMSNNALNAYAGGERPISKWSKTDILHEIALYASQEGLAVHTEFLRGVSLDVLKDVFLVKSSWHHTSLMYNKTDFYSLNEDAVSELTEDRINTLIEQTKLKKLVKTEPEKELWECQYLVWSGSRTHPKATEEQAVGEIKGNWFYLPGGGKKSVTATGFKKLRKVENEKQKEASLQQKAPKL